MSLFSFHYKTPRIDSVLVTTSDISCIAGIMQTDQKVITGIPETGLISSPASGPGRCHSPLPFERNRQKRSTNDDLASPNRPLAVWYRARARLAKRSKKRSKSTFWPNNWVESRKIWAQSRNVRNVLCIKKSQWKSYVLYTIHFLCDRELSHGLN